MIGRIDKRIVKSHDEHSPKCVEGTLYIESNAPLPNVYSGMFIRKGIMGYLPVSFFRRLIAGDDAPNSLIAESLSQMPCIGTRQYSKHPQCMPSFSPLGDWTHLHHNPPVFQRTAPSPPAFGLRSRTGLPSLSSSFVQLDHHRWLACCFPRYTPIPLQLHSWKSRGNSHPSP